MDFRLEREHGYTGVREYDDGHNQYSLSLTDSCCAADATRKKRSTAGLSGDELSRESSGGGEGRELSRVVESSRE
jgi:hypothetical protein